MGRTLGLLVLCLQTGLLSHALDCSGTSQVGDCVGVYAATEAQNEEGKQQRALSPPGSQTQNVIRRKRQADRPTHRGQPGAFSAKGFPKTLVQSQTERARRQLGKSRWVSPHSGVKTRRNLGAYSLIVHNRTANPLQVSPWQRESMETARTAGLELIGSSRVIRPPPLNLATRVLRQVKNEPPRRSKEGRSGAYSVLGDPQNEGQNDRVKRSIEQKRTEK